MKIAGVLGLRRRCTRCGWRKRAGKSVFCPRCRKNPLNIYGL